MGTVKQPYGHWTQEMLESLRRRGLFKVEAFVAWLGEQGIHVDRTLVSHWCAGRSHLPADLLPLLAEFSSRPDIVFSNYLRHVGCDVFRVPAGRPQDQELVDLVLDVGAALGRLQTALRAARAPESPGGTAITQDERTVLLQQTDELIQQLADLRMRMAAGAS
jgi:hypothetical protein